MHTVRSLSIQFQRCFPLVLLALCLLLQALASAQGGDPQQDLRVQLAQVAAITGTPMIQGDGPIRTVDFDSAWSRIMLIYKYRNWNPGNPQMAQAWYHLEDRAQQCLEILVAIAEIDKREPSGWDLVIKTLRDNNTQEKRRDRNDTYSGVVLAELGKGILIDMFRDAEAELDRAIGNLAEIGRGLARPSQAVYADYFPSWNGVYASDLLELRNASGGSIDDAAVAVTVHESNGKSLVHVHYISHWENGALMTMQYPYSSSGYTYALAAADPASVDVAVYNRNGGVATRYVLDQSEWDKKIKNYCSKLMVRGNFLGEYVDGSNQRFAPGFQFSFQGLGRLPVKKVVFRFWASDDDSASQGVEWKIEKMLDSGTIYDYRSNLFEQGRPSFNHAYPPKHVELELELYDTDYKPRFDFY